MLELKEGYGYSPTLVAVCSEDGAVLCADSRMVTVDGCEAVFIDTCRRIFKVNDKFLYGTAGMFPTDAMMVEPLVGQDCGKLNVTTAIRVVEDYLLEQKAVGSLRESMYVLAGEDREGKMCVAVVSYNEDDDTIYTDRKYCNDKDIIWMSLSPIASLDTEHWHKRLTEILSADNGAAVKDKVSAFVTELSRESMLIGGEITTREIISLKEKAPGD